MKLKLELHTFPDTLNSGRWIGTVRTTTPNGQEHGFFVEGNTEPEVMASLTDDLGNFIHKVRRPT